MNDQPGRAKGKFIPKVPPLIGFAAEDISPGAVGKICKRALYTSDDPTFHKLIKGLTKSLFVHLRAPLDSVSLILAVLHRDGSAHLFVNDEVAVVITAKLRATSAPPNHGQPVARANLLDTGPMELREVDINETDNIAFCFKVDWKFGLFFDFDEDRSNRPLNKDQMWATLGSAYRLLKFGGVFAALEQVPLFDRMTNDGWFPFQELVLSEWEKLVEIYVANGDVAAKVGKLLDGYDKERIARISGKWWSNVVFSGKRKLLEAGINAYLQGSDDGNISAIKTLYTEVEGLLNSAFLNQMGRAPSTQKELLSHLSQRVAEVAGHKTSLFLPDEFSQYMTEVVFGNFDQTKEVALSRHSVSHGVAKPDSYTRERAFQAILIVDQLFYFL